MADKPKTITVTSGLGNNDVALWEKHPKHPDEEIYVAGENEVEVAETPRVMNAIAEGRLVKVEDKKKVAAAGKASDSK